MNRKDAGMLQRKQFAFKAESVSEDGTFKGYGSVFGNVDSYREVVAPGAFTKSLEIIKASGDPLPALWQHRSDQPIGGYDVLREDEKGLWVEGFLLVDDVPLAKQAHALMKRRVVKGLSIGYYVRADSYDEKKNIRTLTELDLQEVSPVTFPANDQAGIDEVKAACMDAFIRTMKGGGMPTIKEFENFLREVGFSKSEATAVATAGHGKLLSRSESGGEKGNAVLAALRGLTLTP